jgi:hypothetical protein
MQKNSNRSGLALGAIFALVSSLFVSAPAQAATDGSDIGIYPVVESGSSASAFVGVLGDDFPLVVQGKGNFAIAASTNLTFKVEKTAGTAMDVGISASAAVLDMSNSASVSASVSGQVNIVAGSTSATLSAIVANGVAHLNFRASSVSGVASWSPVTLKITVWRDNQGGSANDTINSDEPFTTQTVTLLHPKDLTRTITITDIISGSSRVTASATVTAVNLGNLSHAFQLVSSTSGEVAVAPANFGSAASAGTVALRSGVVSGSATVGSGFYGADKVYIGLYYNAIQVGATASATVGAAKATALVVEVVESDDAVGAAGNVTSSAMTFNLRPNKTYTVKVTALNNTLSAAALPLEVAMTGPAIAATGSLSIDGGAATTSYPSKLALTTATDGTASFKFSTTGFAAAGAFTVTVKSSQLTQTATLNLATAAFTVVNDRDLYSTTPGTAVSINFDVEDQWGVASDRTNQRIQVTRGGDGFAYAETISYVAVAAGKATLAFTPSPATKTGSATVATVLQQFDADANTWVAVANSAGDAITVNVTDKANGFTGSALASVSASISYAVATGKYSWSTTVLTVTVVNPGSAVTVALPGGIIEDNETGKTYSATVTLTSSTSGTLKLRFAAAKVAKHVVTFTNGTATTTSEFIVTAAASSSAKIITMGAETVVAGQTTTITGTLTDAAGNGIETSALGVKWTGKGLPFNIGSAVATDEAGKFSFQVLALAGETGEGVATVTFKPTAVAADDITATKTYTIAAPAAVAGPEINAVIGSFNGRWAVRVENATGAVVSVKVGNRWVKYTSLNDNYLFSRKSRVGATLPVAVYVNGQLENVATITIK